ncbi:MAG: helix-turn-helix transcriptional regulator, partial [Treponema sp.]|nr:helix-turn-helix transcriptional regulator [Treponema sp.]
MGVRQIFIKNLKFYRKKAGLTQEKLAEAIGMSTAYIGDMEARERFPSAETIDKIA